MEIKQAKPIDVFYLESDKKVARSEYEYNNLLDAGYTPVDIDEDYPIHMNRKARLSVIVEDERFGEITLDAKEEVLRFFGKKKISRKLSEKFRSELLDGDISIFTDGVVVYLRTK